MPNWIQAQVERNTMRGKFPMIMLAALFLTFAVFFASSLRRGSAINGKVESGNYYVGQHGNYKQVSRGYYVFSASLTALIGLELPLLVCSALWHESREKSRTIWHPAYLAGGFMSLLVGAGFFLKSIECILLAV